MTTPVVYVDRSHVKPGKEATLRARLAELADVVEAEVKGAFAYNVYFTPDRRRMTVVHVQRDARSLERHMKVAGRLFPKFKSLVRLERIDVYGHVSEAVALQLQSKVELLGGIVEIHDHAVGFARFERKGRRHPK